MAQSFFGGVHPNDEKAATNKKPIERLTPPPAEVVIPMSMHIGAPCKPVVSAGDYVKMGQLIGEAVGAVSAPIHASVSGTVTAVEPRPSSMGGTVLSVVIANDLQNTPDESVCPVPDPDALTAEELCECVRRAGIVGMGGATFPTYLKISSGIGKVQTVIINGVECEPYLTGDHRTMLERGDQILGGARLLARMFGVDRVFLGIERNKMNAVALLTHRAADEHAPLEVVPLRVRYPQGAEKQLCQAITGKQVPPGALPSAIGCAVFNLNSVCAIYRAVYEGMPVVRKVVTVSGSGVVEPRNLECPIGTPVSCLLDACGGVKEGTFKLIMGGPMMGLAQCTADVPVGKGTGAILAFAGDEEKTAEEPSCIRCGRCVSACPMHLEPVFLYLYEQKNLLDEMEKANLTDCIECGACAYVCPGRLHLVQAFRTGKQRLREEQARRKAAEEAAKKEAAT